MGEWPGASGKSSQPDGHGGPCRARARGGAPFLLAQDPLHRPSAIYSCLSSCTRVPPQAVTSQEESRARHSGHEEPEPTGPAAVGFTLMELGMRTLGLRRVSRHVSEGPKPMITSLPREFIGISGVLRPGAPNVGHLPSFVEHLKTFRFLGVST